ncbi:MAG: VOC family protein [Acidobacteria bacterium]|nr:VOC family protein [Acidobacteriota bacterium]
MPFPLALVLLPFSLQAQLPAPNDQGVAMGHLHLNTTDPDASRKFWVDFMGAAVTKLGATEVYKFPDVLVMVRKAAVSGGSDGSAVNHLGFKVRNLDAYLARCEKMGIQIERRMLETRQAFVLAPDGVRLELTEDAALSAPIVHHHIHFFNTAVLETQAWYAKMFGARPGKRGRFDAADLPGVNLSFSPAPAATAPTKGRAVDHIGFEVRDLEAFVKRLEGMGVKFDTPYRKLAQIGLAIAFFTDPWGTYVELTEGLNKL